MSNANGGPAHRDGIVHIPQLTYVKVEDNHQDDLVLVERWKMVTGVVKREPGEASQPVRGLGGPAQVPPAQVKEWLARAWPISGAQPRGLGGPAQAPAVQEAPAAVEQPAVHVPVHNEQAPAAAVQAPAPGGPVRRTSGRITKPSQALRDYGRFSRGGWFKRY